MLASTPQGSGPPVPEPNVIKSCGPEFPRFYRQIIALRKTQEAIRRGPLEWLRNFDEAHVVTYVRLTPREEILVAINFSNRPFVGFVETGNGAAFTGITPDVAPPLPPDAPAPERGLRVRAVGLPALALDAWGYRIFRRAVR